MSIKIRDFCGTPEDFAAIVEIDNATYPEYSGTVAEAKRSYKIFDKDKYILRYYLAEKDGKTVGYAVYHHTPERFHPQRFWVWVAVLPEHQDQGIGTALYEKILEDLRKLEARWLWTSSREDRTKILCFLQKRGFKEVFRSWESRLDVSKFHIEPFLKYLEQVKREGVEITSLERERELNPDWLPKVYDLHTAIMKDVPSPVAYTPPPLEEFRKQLIENPNLLFGGYFLAKAGENYVGESFVTKSPAEPGNLYQGLTGVREGFRGKGIAMALKLHVIRFAKEHGYTMIKTWNATVNTGMIAINEKLGFVRQPAWIEYQKTLA